MKKVLGLFPERYHLIILFLVRLFLIYTVLSLCFYAYVGLVDPRGSVYSPFLHEYSLIQVILDAIIYPVAWMLDLIGHIPRYSENTVGIMLSNGVIIAFPCLGVQIMIAWLALLWGYPKGSKKVLFTFFGLIGIHLINIFRVLAIILTNHADMDLVDESHTVYNLFSYGFVILFFYFWLQNYADQTDKA